MNEIIDSMLMPFGVAIAGAILGSHRVALSET